MQTREPSGSKSKKVSRQRPTAAPQAARQAGRAIFFGPLAAAAVFFCLQPTFYETEAVVGVGSAATPLRGAMTEAAASAVVSKPVMSRAASSLNGTKVTAPAPSLLDKLRVALRLDRAAARDARLADTLSSQVTATPTGDAGIVKITARAPEAAAAAQIATGVAEALIDEQDVQTVDLRRRRDNEAARTIEGLRANALMAHRKFESLGGGVQADPAQARTAAVAQTKAAQARLDVVRSILSSGTPPVSDRRDLPQGVSALQNAYLDLSQQLAKARETLGDRHTTIVSLQEGTKRAAAALTTEWKRLGKVAEADFSAARDRETALNKTAAPADAGKRAALEDARRDVMLADDALARAERANRETPFEENPYRLVAPAPVPVHAVGYSLPWRVSLAGLAGLAALFLDRFLARRPLTFKVTAAAPAQTPVVTPVAKVPEAVARRSFFDDVEPTLEAPKARSNNAASHRPEVGHQPATVERANDTPDLDEVLPALEAIDPQGDVPIVLVASNEPGEATTPIALALGQAVAASGRRVLIVEAATSLGALAASADAEADPVLVDVFGTLRVALPSETQDGFVYLVPALRNGDRIAARLARSGDVPMLDDLAVEFDIIIVDGADAARSVDVMPTADAFLRVARYPSKRDDRRFLATCGGSEDSFLGTITAFAFVPREEERVRPVPAPRHQERGVPQPARAVRYPSPPAAAPRRRVGAR